MAARASCDCRAITSTNIHIVMMSTTDDNIATTSRRHQYFTCEGLNTRGDPLPGQFGPARSSPSVSKPRMGNEGVKRKMAPVMPRPVGRRVRIPATLCCISCGLSKLQAEHVVVVFMLVRSNHEGATGHTMSARMGTRKAASARTRFGG